MRTFLSAALLGIVCMSGTELAAGPNPFTPVNTCTGTYPSYWQDVDPKFADMWQGQVLSNAPTGAYSGLAPVSWRGEVLGSGYLI